MPEESKWEKKSNWLFEEDNLTKIILQSLDEVILTLTCTLNDIDGFVGPKVYAKILVDHYGKL